MSKQCPIRKVLKRSGTVVVYDRKRISTAIYKATVSLGRGNRKLSEKLAVEVEKALVSTYRGDMVPTVEDIQDVVERVLMEHRLTDLAKDYILYRHQRARERAARVYEFEVSDNVPYRKIYEVLRWNMNHRCDTVDGLNRIIRGGEFPDLVRATDRRYNEEVALAADLILRRLKDIRIAIVAGPSSSGKTTTMIKVSEKLKSAGVAFKAMNIDHYFFDLESHPKDEFGDYDYETPQALDLKMINDHLVQLLDGKEIKTPDYNFKTGQRTLNVHPLRLNRNEILLIDSLHGLHEDMTCQVPAGNKFKLYVETLGQFRAVDGTFMRWADNRLLRRMNRDKHFRNLQPLQTLTHWHYVRHSELRNIIPFIKHTDCIVNTALPYELPVFRHTLFRTISKGIHSYAEDPRRLDAHIRGNRVYELLKPLKALKDHSCIPGHSLLREFIGGSTYRY
jgi:uridine kinase